MDKDKKLSKEEREVVGELVARLADDNLDEEL